MDKKPFSITPVYDRLLRGSVDTPIGLYQLQIATAAQLTKLHYSAGSIKTVKARLKDLADHGFVQADGIPTKFSRSPYYYALAQKGIQYLEAAGLDTNDAFRASKEVNDLLISAALLQRVDPRFCLHDFKHERTLKRSPYRAAWQERGQTQTATIIPDAFLDVRLQLSDGKQRRLPLLLEHDRGSEEQQHFKRRIRAYREFIRSGTFKTLLGVTTVTVCFTTFMGMHRLVKMQAWTQEALDGDTSVQGLFLFGDLSQPLDSRQFGFELHWYSVHLNQPPFSLLAER